MVFGVDVFDLDLGIQINSIKQPSSATLWVLETCLIVRLLPLMIILITASLSSNTYNKASWREDWTFEGTASMSLITSTFLWDLFLPFRGCPVRSEIWETFPKTETIRSHNSRAGKPSNLNPVSKETISDSVELWETAVCFLHIQLIGTNVWLPKMHNVPPEVDFESSRSPAKSESWNSTNLHCLAVLPTWQYCLYLHVWWMYEINRFRRLSQALVHFVIDRPNLFTDHRISGRPTRAKYKNFRTIWEHTCDNSPTDFISSSLKWWSSDLWCKLMHITNQAQLCGFLTRVSLLDFCLQWSFWSLLHCFQRCATETHQEKSVRLWWRDPPATIDDISVSLLFRGWILLFREQFLAAGWVGGLVRFDERNTSVTTSHQSWAGNTSIRSPASHEMISASGELWDPDVCFSHIQLIGTDVRLPKIHKNLPGWFWILKVASKIRVLE